MTQVVPETYEQWRHCIEIECGLELTAQFAAERLTALLNRKDHHTNRFFAIWGTEHHARVLDWFRRAQAELAVTQRGDA